MYTDSNYEKLAIIVILLGCGIAIAFAFIILICCQFFVKPKYSKYNRSQPNSQHVVVFERQTTTSDENNADFSGFEDSITQIPQQYDSEDKDIVGPQSIMMAQTHSTPMQSSLSQHPRSSTPQVTFASVMPKNRKASLPCKFISQQMDEIKKSETKIEVQRRASAGIIRQKGFEDVEEDMQLDQSNRSRDSMDIEKEEISPETTRRQYRELWKLRATFEAEEMEMSAAESVHFPTYQFRGSDQKLSKNDSGYKSIERRDFSIDYKTESIFRQFTTITAPQRHQQSIEEEQETDMQATYV